MIANALGILIGFWDGFAGVFYDHAHPMSRSYAVSHALGRRAGAMTLWPVHPDVTNVIGDRSATLAHSPAAEQVKQELPHNLHRFAPKGTASVKDPALG
jgi:hypothetical protein